MKGPRLLLSAAFLLLAVYTHSTVGFPINSESKTNGIFAGLSVMSVDLGSEFMKIAIVKPGVPMEIVLNKESRRKTPVVVSFRNEERLFGDAALNTAVKYPQNAFWFLRELLGKKLDNPMVTQYKKRFPYYNLVEDEKTGLVAFQIDENTVYSVEELLGMILEYAKHQAEAFAEQPISDAVITVPVYFNQAERRALIRAAELGGLKVLQLMTDNTAVALNYGVFRRKEFNGTAQYLMFYDMGTTSTTATIVEYKVVQTKEHGFAEKNPQLTIKGVGFDRHLGGLEMQLRLREHLGKLFNAQKKTTNNVFENKRSMGKLFKEAGRLKQVLSANADHFSQVEGLLDDKDFRAKVTRDEYEELCKDMLDRVKLPVEEALKSSHMTMTEISGVILMGAGTRMPKVQEHLIQATGRQDLGKSINTDEAAAMGAVYQAAHLSKGFKVKKFVVRDANMYPVMVDFQRTKLDEEGKETTKMVRRTLFGRMNPYPQKKVMTFNKHTADFDFNVNYGELDFLAEDDVKTFDNLNLTKISLTGVGDAHTKHTSDKVESKGVKAHFRMDESGLLHLDRVESLFEKAPPTEEELAAENESTLSKLGNTISNFFSGTEDGKKEEKGKEESKEQSSEEAKKDETKPEDKETDKTEKASEKDSESEKAEKTKDKKPEEKDKKEEDKKDEKSGSGKTGNDTSSKNDTTAEKPSPKPTTIKENITSEVKIMDCQDPDTEAVKLSLKKISDLAAADKERDLLGKAKNDLETFIFDTQSKLYEEAYEQASTETEREQLNEKLTAASDWQYEQEEDAKKDVFKDKLKELQDATKDLFARVKEHTERPKALEALKDMLNHSVYFHKAIKNLTEVMKDDQPYTEVEVTTLEKLINDTKKWRKDMLKEQKGTPLTEKPKLLVEDIAQKVRSLDREVNYLLNKAKSYVPKKKPETNSTSSTNETKTDSDKSSNETKKTDSDNSSNETKTKNDDKKEYTIPLEEKDDVKEPKDSQKAEKVEDTKTEDSKSTDEVPTLDLPPPAQEETETKKSEETAEEKSKSTEKKDTETTTQHSPKHEDL